MCRGEEELPEGNSGVCGGDAPTINNFSLSQPFVRLAQGNLGSIRSYINLH